MKRLLTILILATTAVMALPAMAYDAFTPVTNVCPTCTQPPADVVTMSDGAKLRCKIISENTNFYVGYANGEVRMLPKTEVQKIEWQSGQPPMNLKTFDQIVLNNGHVLSGTIVEDKNSPPLFQIKLSEVDVTIMVNKDQIKQLFRAGEEKAVEIPQPKASQ